MNIFRKNEIFIEVVQIKKIIIYICFFEYIYICLILKMSFVQSLKNINQKSNMALRNI